MLSAEMPLDTQVAILRVLISFRVRAVKYPFNYSLR